MSPFGGGERLTIVRDCARLSGAENRGLLMSVVRGAGAPDQRAGGAGGDRRRLQFVESTGQGVFGSGGVSALSEMDSKSV